MRIGTTCGRVVWILSLVSVSVGAQAERPYTSIVEGYETVTVADNVYAFIARESESNVVNGNTLAVVGDDGVLVVDTGQIPTLTKRMIADIRRITALPVRYVVNTHFHGDHNVGNSVYRDAFPGVVVIAHENTRRAMHTSMLAFFEKGIAEQLKIGNLLRTRLETGKGRDGAPLTDEMRQLYIRDLADLEPVLEDIQANARFLPPELTFTDRLHIRLGKREVQILYLGRGNTDGDAVVYVPDAGVLASGDLVVSPTPFSFGSYLGEWQETLRKVVLLTPRAIVPGHGPVLRDTRYVEQLIGLFSATLARVRAAAADGASLDEVRKRVTFADFRQELAGDHPYRRRAFDEFFVRPAVERAYLEITGKLIAAH